MSITGRGWHLGVACSLDLSPDPFRVSSVSHRPLVLVSGLTVGDYLLWNWSLNHGHDVLALISGLTLPPLAIACLWLLAVSVARLLARSTRRSPVAPAGLRPPPRPPPHDRTGAARARRATRTNARAALTARPRPSPQPTALVLPQARRLSRLLRRVSDRRGDCSHAPNEFAWALAVLVVADRRGRARRLPLRAPPHRQHLPPPRPLRSGAHARRCPPRPRTASPGRSTATRKDHTRFFPAPASLHAAVQAALGPQRATRCSSSRR